MRAVIQHVREARVLVEGVSVGAIEAGLLAYVGVAAGDTPAEADWLADRIARLRILADEAGRMNRSLLEVSGAALVVSQFTLLADTRRGRRPSFFEAAPPEEAEPLIEAVMAGLRERGVAVEAGRFGAMMQVESVNDGPVTIILDSAGIVDSAGH